MNLYAPKENALQKFNPNSAFRKMSRHITCRHATKPYTTRRRTIALWRLTPHNVPSRYHYFDVRASAIAFDDVTARYRVV